MTATRGISAVTSRGHQVQVIAGFALLCAAQYLCAQTRPVPVVVQFPLTDALNQYWHIDVPNLHNVVVAVMCLALGGYLIGRGLAGYAPLDSVLTPRRGGSLAPSG